MTEDDRDVPAAAKYPSTDRSEHNAIDVLNYLLDKRVKSRVDSRDKTPNHDGWLELVNKNDEPIGRINVQVKILPKKYRENPRIQIKTKNLAYCFVSNDPFVLIVVDVDEEIGYWTHISKKWYKSEGLQNQKSKVVKLSRNNQIRKTNKQYVKGWMRLIKDQGLPYCQLDKPPKGAVNWGHRLNQNFEEINRCVSDLSSELDISGVGDYKLITIGQTKWDVPLNKNFQKIENDLKLLAKEVNVENVGGYHRPDRGKQDWHVDLNHNFSKIEDDINNIAKAMQNFPR